MPGLYALALIISLAGLASLDARYKLAFWHNARRTTKTLAAAMVFFVLWDLADIGLGIFFVGPSSLLTGLRLAPEFPVEELLFLLLLTYVPLLLYRWRQTQ